MVSPIYIVNSSYFTKPEFSFTVFPVQASLLEVVPLLNLTVRDLSHSIANKTQSLSRAPQHTKVVRRTVGVMAVMIC